VVFIPKQDRARFLPLEMDPPEHAGYRGVITPVFTPKAVSAWAEEARRLAGDLIDGFHGRGECEFVTEFAQQLPIIVFLKMCNLPLADRPMLLRWIGQSVRPASLADRAEGGRQLGEYVATWLAERRVHPGDDLLSRLVTAEIDGRRMTADEALQMGRAVLGGGLDTVSASMTFAARFLAENPAHAQQLIEDPKLIPNAVDELFRRFPVPNIARVAARDIVWKGATLREGDLILLPTVLHGLDERCFEDPLTVDFRRKSARNHSAFSRGIHNCPGASLARAEMRIFLEEWLQRIPRFRIAAGKAARMGTGIVHSVLALPLSWEVPIQKC
jgi:cytochrome P450